MQESISVEEIMGNHDQVTEETVEVVQIIPQERVQNRMAKQIVEVVRSIPMERILERIPEQIVDMRETQKMEKIIKIPEITQQVENTQYRCKDCLKTGSSSESLNKLWTHMSTQP